MDNKQRDEIVLKCFRHHFQGRPRTIAELLAEQISINTVAARHSYNSDEEETDDVGSRSEVHPDVWNHAVHARGASFGFNTPFIPNNNDRFSKIQQFSKKNNFLISRQEYIEELEKWSSPPSYNAVIEHDNHVTHDDIDNGNDDHITIDMIQSDGLPSYDDACRISNINNNYI